MPQAMTEDVDKRIQQHIEKLGSPDSTAALRSEGYLIRYGSKAVGLLIEATASNNPNIRCRAVWTLGKIRDGEAYSHMVKLMGDPEDVVRYDAIVALGELGDPHAIDPLIAVMQDPSSSGELASAAAMALAKFGKAAVVPLGRSLAAPTREGCIFAAYTLGNIGDDSAINDLLPILSDPDDEKRLAAIEAIAIIGAPRSRTLIEPLTHDASEKVRKTAAYWCSKLKPPPG